MIRARAPERLPAAPILARYATPLALIGVTALAAYLRLHCLLPVERGLQYPQDYDEGVWATTAQLMLQGHVPYRDFFATVPPVGIYLLAGVLRLVYTPWGSGAALMATRYASVCYGLASVVVVYLLGREVAGRRTGLAAAALLSLDGLVIGMDRRAMLEPPLNLFSCLAVLAYASSSKRAQGDALAGWLAGAAGLLAALSALSKTPGWVVVLVLLAISLLRRRSREAAIIAASFGLGWLALNAYFLFKCPEEMVKQVYVFQLLRPADGVTHRIARFYDIWRYSQAWLTVRLGAVGALFALWHVLKRRLASPWSPILAWGILTLALISVNSSYWPQYYVQLAVPLSLLGGGLLCASAPAPLPSAGSKANRYILTMGRLALAVVLLVGLASGAVVGQWLDVTEASEQTSSTYTETAAYLRDKSSAQASVLAFEPNYTFLSSRPPAGKQVGRFLVDSYGEMLYLNLGIGPRSWSELVTDALHNRREGLQHTFWQTAAQDEVLAAFARAQYVILDGRARYQLRPETLATIRDNSTEVLETDIAGLRERL